MKDVAQHPNTGMLAPANDRIVELDVLRGLALFGVFAVNMTGFVSSAMISTSAQQEALPTARLDAWLDFLLH